MRLYGRRVALQGWAELLAWMQERSAAGELDPDAVWNEFRALAVTSEQPGVPELANRFHPARAQDRLMLAATVSRMLAVLEWPSSWREPRDHLLSALEDLVREFDALEKLVDLGDKKHHLSMGRNAVVMGREMLRTPCRRDQLALVATTCTSGVLSCAIVVSEAAAEAGYNDALAVAYRHFIITFNTFAEAARAMNSVCGSVLFDVRQVSLFPQKAI